MKDDLFARFQHISLPVEARTSIALIVAVFAVLAANVIMSGHLPSPI
jgi:hypothetical protein